MVRTRSASALRRVFSPAFQAAQSVLFIHWRVVAAPLGGPAISFLWNDGGAGRAMGSASPRPARNGVGMGPFLCGVCSLRHFRRRSRYSLSIGGVAAEPRGGPAISFLWNDGGAGRGVCEVWGQRRRAARNRWPWGLDNYVS